MTREIIKIQQTIMLTKLTGDIKSIVSPFGLDQIQVEKNGESLKSLMMIIPYQKKETAISYPIHSNVWQELDEKGYRVSMMQANKNIGLVVYLVVKEGKKL